MTMCACVCHSLVLSVSRCFRENFGGATTGCSAQGSLRHTLGRLGSQRHLPLLVDSSQPRISHSVTLALQCPRKKIVISQVSAEHTTLRYNNITDVCFPFPKRQSDKPHTPDIGFAVLSKFMQISLQRNSSTGYYIRQTFTFAVSFFKCHV